MHRRARPGRWRGRRGGLGGLALLAAGVASAGAAARDFDNPASHDTSQQFASGSVQRQDTPNDPGYDQAEPDDAADRDGDVSRPPTSTTSASTCSASRRRAPAHRAALHRPARNAGKPQVSGFNAAGAWKVERGRPDVAIAILDTGIKWDKRGAAHPDPPQHGRAADPEHGRSSRAPMPAADGLSTCDAYDCNGDGAFNVDDYVCDSRSASAGRAATARRRDHRPGPDPRLLRRHATPTTTATSTTSPAGTSSTTTTTRPTPRATSPPHNHGTGRAVDAAEQGNDGAGSIGVCPHCQIMPVRTWDTFVSDGNTFALGIALRDRQRRRGDRGRQRQPLPLGLRRGGLPVRLRPRRRADLLRRRPQHRQPQLPRQLRPRDADPGHRARHGRARRGRRASGGAGARRDCAAPTRAAGRLPRAPTCRSSTYFRGANTTQYGGKSSISMEGPTGSVNTGKASGAAGAGGQRRPRPTPASTLRPDETRELLEQTAERVLTGNTGGAGVPDPAADPTLPRDEQWTTALRLGPRRPRRRRRRRRERQDPAGGGDRLARLVRAADRLERRDHAASRGPASPPAASFHWKLSGAPARRRRHGHGARAATRPATVTDFGSIDLNARAQRARRATSPPPDAGGPTFAAGEPNPFKHEFTVRLVVNGQAIPTAGRRPPRVHLAQRPDAARRLPEAAGHRRRGADPLRRPQRRQHAGADRPDRGRRRSTPTSRTAPSSRAGRSTPAPRSPPRPRLTPARPRWRRSDAAARAAARPGGRRPRRRRRPARSSTRPAPTSTPGSPTASRCPASRSSSNLALLRPVAREPAPQPPQVRLPRRARASATSRAPKKPLDIVAPCARRPPLRLRPPRQAAARASRSRSSTRARRASQR